MSDQDFVAQVARALEEIPHGRNCPIGVPLSGTHPDYVGHLCTCDRERRVAERVAGAMEAATAVHSPCWPDSARRAALRALAGGEPQ